MTTTDNALPEILQPTGDICIPVVIPNDSEWLWLLAKCLSFPTAKRFWLDTDTPSVKIVQDEWDSRVYNPLVDKILNGILCDEDTSDDCVEYPMSVEFVTYAPQNPFTDAGVIPDGYLMSPFVRFADILPEFLPDWFQDLVADIALEFTGYEPNDILVLVGSFPLLGSWQDIITSGLPRIDIAVSGQGTVEIHFLNVPLGGRVLITIDVEPNIGDILSGIISDGFRLIELDRDFVSIPPELDVDHIEQIDLDDDEPHIIYCTWLPVLNDTLVPFGFGGGIRRIELCGVNATVEVPPTDCDLPTMLQDEEFFNDTYRPIIFGDIYTGNITHNETLETAYDDTPQSIGSTIPVGAPDSVEQNALCYAWCKFVRLYASEKLCVIQSRNFLSIAWQNLNFAIQEAYNEAASHALYNFLPDLWSCIVSDDDAMIALADTAAIEELGCYCWTYSKDDAITNGMFLGVLTAALSDLSGNAQVIACMMETDAYPTAVYLNFLEAYNTGLLRQIDGEYLDCPCIDSGTPEIGVANSCVGGLTPCGDNLTNLANNRWQAVSTLLAGGVYGVSIKRADNGNFHLSNVVITNGGVNYYGFGEVGEICTTGVGLPDTDTHNFYTVLWTQTVDLGQFTVTFDFTDI